MHDAVLRNRVVLSGVPGAVVVTNALATGTVADCRRVLGNRQLQRFAWARVGAEGMTDFGSTPQRLPVLSSNQLICTHGVTFDEDAARNLDWRVIQRLWPRFMGTCKHCGYSGIYYASYAHYILGDW